MSHPMLHDDNDSEDNIILKPKPRRPFELSSPPPSAPSTPPPSQKNFPAYLPQPASTNPGMDGTATPSRNRSFLNLTSSTLFGIYQPTGYSTERGDTTTPWGTGAQTPAESPATRRTSVDWSRANIPDNVTQNGTNASKFRRKSTAVHQQVHRVPRRGFKGYVLPLIGRTLALFAIGVSYALLITHLHDRRELAPVKVELNRGSWYYLVCWGLAGVLLGEALPWADRFWAPEGDEDDEEMPKPEHERRNRGLDGWMDVVRSIGAFVGIAFAIRRLPWQSTLQLSLTLALANPALWYLIDRSPPGFILSSFFSLCGTAVLVAINPALVPSPSPAQVLRGLVWRGGGVVTTPESEDLVLGVFSPESVGIATWIASVLFVSSVCFGNIGRRLAPRKP
ncbi:hypothetical protein LTR37_010379 [Vermiconidia calcicola]|uniref:Uncharacterized protein n=1 Tax=Vermiconidia calcicola TaxID=1690605 RepID=A0ACC3N6V0_9PEZI|nr:hypothetical protein LTR37_010379 [Vermiconidia calcicola]